MLHSPPVFTRKTYHNDFNENLLTTQMKRNILIFMTLSLAFEDIQLTLY